MYKSLTIFFLIIIILTGCSSVEVVNNEEVIHISEEEFDAARVRFKNDSLSNNDFLMAVIQSVPILPLGTNIKQVKLELNSTEFRELTELEGTILIKGKNSISSDSHNIEIEQVNIFIYTFKDSLLTSGPNVIKDKQD